MIKIIQAAVRDHSGLIYTLPQPNRYVEIYKALMDIGYTKTCSTVRGFLCSDGSFADPKQAAKIAIHSGQVDTPNGIIFLATEDLW